MNELIMIITEIIGTIAFAISGALVAISCSLDILGVVFVGVITAVGGGALRDMLIGNHPPKVFSNEYILILAAITTLIVFMVSYINRHRFTAFKEKIDRINNVFDAIGLSAFTISGAEIAYSSGFSEKIIFVVFMGMLTGVGGGIFRDVLVSKTPYVFKKHIYALASIAGCLLYCILRRWFGETIWDSIISMIFIIAIRLLATKFRWSLPKIKPDEEEALKPYI